MFICWIQSFLTERITMIRVLKGELPHFDMKTGISQGSFILLILFLFFIAELLNTVDNAVLCTSAIGFIDDMYILTYGYLTERNCRTLECIHEECMNWAKRHSAKFASEKYKLIHFATRPKCFNLRASISINGLWKEASDSVWVLRVQINLKLK